MQNHNGLWIIFIALSLAVTGGCKTQQTTNRASRGASGLIATYNVGDYRGAFASARQIADTSSRSDRYVAAYIAGKSARKLNDRTSADRYLRIAAQSGDRTLSGQAMAELGLLFAQNSHFEFAANTLLQAAPRLTGQDRANAFLHAGLAQQKLGRWTQARDNFRMAEKTSSDPSFRKQIARQLAVSGYTLQFGAFKQSANAKQLAQQIAGRAAAVKAGSPRLVTTAQGLYLVQVGRYSDYTHASRVRTQFGGQPIIVPLGVNAK